MYTEILSRLSGAKLNKWKSFLAKVDLVADSLIEKTVIVWNGEEIAATGSRYSNILKLIAVDPMYRGEDLTSTVISELRRDAFNEGYRSLFLYTKPQNETVFNSLFFSTIARTDKVVLLEDKRDGIANFVNSLPRVNISGVIGSIVMNCNPFTLGHQYLAERAAAECDHLYIFVLSEDRSTFSFDDRFEMAKLGTRHLNNVSILPTGPYLISAATFPTYFLKERDKVVDTQCALDIEIFTRYFVPALGIKRRYVGSEPMSMLTNKYNDALKQYLPQEGVEVIEIERKTCVGEPISASRVRNLISKMNFGELNALLPQTTIDYIREKGYIK